VNAYVCTVGVGDLDDVLARARKLGAALAVPRMPVPGIGWLAYLTDPEGNILGVLQPDTAAA
jgi:predicted enzyme related to lactoylglutathione lyase